jgi:hypothetical protein
LYLLKDFWAHGTALVGKDAYIIAVQRLILQNSVINSEIR